MTETSAIPIPRRDCDTDKSYLALCDYLAMGPERSLEKLAGGHQGGTTAAPISKRLTTLKKWSSEHGWQDRAACYDIALREKARAESEEELTSGLALPGERVRMLKRLVRDLMDEGNEARMQALLRNEGGLLAQLRGLLDDLAKETGGRKVVAETTTKGTDGFWDPITGYIQGQGNIFAQINRQFVESAQGGPAAPGYGAPLPPQPRNDAGHTRNGHHL